MSGASVGCDVCCVVSMGILYLNIRGLLVCVPQGRRKAAELCFYALPFFRTTQFSRMQLTNVTCVVGPNELDYMVYMQAMFASPLAYLQQQTEFLRKDIGVKTWSVSGWEQGGGLRAAW